MATNSDPQYNNLDTPSDPEPGPGASTMTLPPVFVIRIGEHKLRITLELLPAESMSSS